MLIDQCDGAVRIPNGVLIHPTLTQDELRASSEFAASQSLDYGTLPWSHFRLNSGEIDGKDIFVSLCFYDQVLVHVSVSVNHYPPGEWDWSQYSLEVESETKRFHDYLLEQELGPPSNVTTLPRHELSDKIATLAQRRDWKFPWGVVSSGHDFKGGGTEIVIRYRDRQK